jgi:glyoxylase-like metal-dependent hydrolase (beta-lactamase superfamily II)
MVEDQMTKFGAFEASALPLTRRRFMAGAAGLAAASAWPLRLVAAETPHSFRQGDFEVTVVSDGHLVLPISVISPDAPPEELKAILEAAGVTATDEFQPATNVPLIRRGDDLILVDTGSGSGFQPTAGKLKENLAAAGIDPAAITKVVFTHAHPDHAWGTAGDDGALIYPNAEYYVAAAEWDFWMNPDIKSKLPQEVHGFVDGAVKHLTPVKDKVTMLKAGDEIVPGMSVIDSAGHTPGHVSFLLEGGEGLILPGDAITEPSVFFAHPEWKFGFDADPDLAVTNRKALLDRAATDKLKMLGFHWPYPGVGFAERKDNAYRYVPA